MDRYQLSADRLLSVLDSLALPSALLNGLRNLAPAQASVEVLLASDRGALQVLVDGRRFLLTGAARDAVLTLLGLGARLPEERASASSAPADGGLLDLSTAARVASVDAQVQGSRSLAANAPSEVVLTDTQRPATVIAAPLMQSPDVDDAGKSLARAIDSSGLFLEAHFAQALRGERSFRQIEEEARSLPVDAHPKDAQTTDRRSAMQLDALQRQAITLVGQAWTGQPIRIEIERDRERNREAANAGDATGLFVATLNLRLPNLGALRARIRFMETTVGVQLESDQAATLNAELSQLADALAARGLNLAQLAAIAPTDAGL